MIEITVPVLPESVTEGTQWQIAAGGVTGRHVLYHQRRYFWFDDVNANH